MVSSGYPEAAGLPAGLGESAPASAAAPRRQAGTRQRYVWGRRSLPNEPLGANEPDSVGYQVAHGHQCLYAIHEALPKRGRRCLGKVPSRNRHLDCTKTEVDRLGDNLGVKDEVI